MSCFVFYNLLPIKFPICHNGLLVIHYISHNAGLESSPGFAVTLAEPFAKRQYAGGRCQLLAAIYSYSRSECVSLFIPFLN